MNIKDFIPSDNILLLDRTYPDKMDLLRELLSVCISDTPSEKNMDTIWSTLQERELSMSTGIGLGVALPHCSTEYVADAMGALCVLKQGIDFQSVDEEPVRIVVMLLLPKNKFDKHIKTLAAVAKNFNDAVFREKIITADNRDRINSILETDWKS